MDAIAKFKEAALALQQDECYLKLAKARQAHENDKELQEMIGEFNLVRQQLNQEIEKPERDDAKIGELNDKINELYNGIMTNDKMLAYNEAKQDIRGLVNYVQAIVTAAVDGDDPMKVSEPSACGEGGCATCGGCG